MCAIYINLAERKSHLDSGLLQVVVSSVLEGDVLMMMGVHDTVLEHRCSMDAGGET